MIYSGKIRRIDDLGRIVIPKQVREQVFGRSNAEGTPMEIFYNTDGTIMLKPLQEKNIVDLNELIAHKLWKREDLISCMEELECEITEESVCEVINLIDRRALEECHDYEWQVFYDAISRYMETK